MNSLGVGASPIDDFHLMAQTTFVILAERIAELEYAVMTQQSRINNVHDKYMEMRDGTDE